jgi:hypothetical protein
MNRTHGTSLLLALAISACGPDEARSPTVGAADTPPAAASDEQPAPLTLAPRVELVGLADVYDDLLGHGCPLRSRPLPPARGRRCRGQRRCRRHCLRPRRRRHAVHARCPRWHPGRSPPPVDIDCSFGFAQTPRAPRSKSRAATSVRSHARKARWTSPRRRPRSPRRHPRSPRRHPPSPRRRPRSPRRRPAEPTPTPAEPTPTPAEPTPTPAEPTPTPARGKAGVTTCRRRRRQIYVRSSRAYEFFAGTVEVAAGRRQHARRHLGRSHLVPRAARATPRHLRRRTGRVAAPTAADSDGRVLRSRPPTSASSRAEDPSKRHRSETGRERRVAQERARTNRPSRSSATVTVGGRARARIERSSIDGSDGLTRGQPASHAGDSPSPERR